MTSKLFYVYAYLRNKDSTTSCAGSPYYIGKGTNNRAFVSHGKIPVPTSKEHIVFLKENLTEKEAHQFETEMILQFGRKNIGSGILNNHTNGGEGISAPSIETRLKMATAKRNESPETKAKRSLAAKNRIRTPLSDETKQKISVANTGKIKSAEAKNKISTAKSGSTLSDKHKESISNALTGKPKLPFSDSHKENMRNAKLGKPWSDAKRKSQQRKSNDKKN